MRTAFILVLSLCCCVASESVSGKDGGSVTLNTNVTKGQHDIILWAFNGILIARINANPSDSCLYDGEGGRFRDRLEVDYETGSLTIKNITAEHTGRYEAEIIKSESSGTRESLNRKHKCNSNKVTPKTNYLGKTKTYNVSVIDGEPVSVIEGDSVTLHTDVKTNQQDDVKWHFNNIPIAEINRDQSKICEDDRCKERFRNRLKLDHQTGSLTIMNSRNTDSGHFQLIIGSTSKSFDVSVRSLYRDNIKRLPVFVMEGDSLTLLTDVKMNQYNNIRWEFQYKQIAEISGDLSFICTDVQCNKDTERFRDRLKLDHQTGSLTIMNIRNTHSGLYYLEIFNYSKDEWIFSVTVNEDYDEMKRKSVKEGESVTLDYFEKSKTNEIKLMRWYCNEILIAEVTDGLSKTCVDDQCEERFRNRLKVNNQTGSLTIMNSRTENTGLYKLGIIYSRFSISRSFTLTVNEPGLSPAVVAGVGTAILFLAAAASVIYYYKRQARRKVIRQRNQTNNSDQLCVPLN